VQDEVSQEESEPNEVDGMKKGADSMGKVMPKHRKSYKHAKTKGYKIRRQYTEYCNRQ